MFYVVIFVFLISQNPTIVMFTTIAGLTGVVITPRPHPHHHFLYGGHQKVIFRGFLVHPSPVHRLFHRFGGSWNRVSV